MSLVLAHDVAQLLLATRQGLLGARVDAGETDIFPFALHGVSLRALLTDAKGIPLAVGARDRGVWTTRDGGRNWSEAAGTEGVDITALAGSSRDLLAGSAAGAIFRASGGSFSPGVIPGGAGSSVAAIATSGTSVFAALTGGSLFAANDGGTSFRDIGAGLPRGVLSLAVTGDTLWAGTVDGLHATNLATPGAWRQMFSSRERRNVTAVAVNPQRPDHVVCAAARLREQAKPGQPKGADACLYSSHDRGKTWTEAANPGLPVLRGQVTGIVFHPREPERFFAGTTAGEVFDSRDGGRTFRLAAGSLPGVLALCPGPAIF